MALIHYITLVVTFIIYYGCFVFLQNIIINWLNNISQVTFLPSGDIYHPLNELFFLVNNGNS